VGWDLADSQAKKKTCESYGVTLEAYRLPLTASGIDKQIFPNIMLGKSPARDAEIKILQQMIRVAGQTGVPVLTYNATILQMLRTDPVAGRGGSTYRDWDFEKAAASDPGLTIAGTVTADQMFERIAYMLERLLPVAEEANVKLALHIADPPFSRPYRGIMQWNCPDVIQGVKRMSQLFASPSHGFSLCLGSVAEGLTDPNGGIHDVIRFVGQRKQIFNVHLRNIRGKLDKFSEVYHDEGTLDMLKVVRTLREVQYAGMVMPDHAPTHPDDLNSFQAYAFAYGYLKGLIQAVYAETATQAPYSAAPWDGEPVAFSVEEQHPGATGSRARITYSLARAGRVRLTVVNAAGRKVCALTDGHQGAGTHVMEWDCRDLTGRRVPSGSYVCMLNFDNKVMTSHLHVVK
jgi:mannonate dehydratase